MIPRSSPPVCCRSLVVCSQRDEGEDDSETSMTYAEIVTEHNITSRLSAQSAAMIILTSLPQVSKFYFTASGGGASIHVICLIT